MTNKINAQLLSLAINKGLASTVKKLVVNKELVDAVDNNGNTPFHLAFIKAKDSWKDSWEVLEVLLNAVNDKSEKYLNKKNNEGKTPLDYYEYP